MNPNALKLAQIIHGHFLLMPEPLREPGSQSAPWEELGEGTRQRYLFVCERLLADFPIELLTDSPVVVEGR